MQPTKNIFFVAFIQKKDQLARVGLFSVIFAYGEFYCFAVIFGLRRVIFASRVWEVNIISLKP